MTSLAFIFARANLRKYHFNNNKTRENLRIYHLKSTKLRKISEYFKMQLSSSLQDVFPVNNEYTILKCNSLPVLGMIYQWMTMDTSLAGTLFAVFAAIVGLAVLTQVLISKDICRLLKYMFKYTNIKWVS